MVKNMKMKCLISVILLTFFIMSCTNEQKPIGGQKDEFGCLTPAGFSWDENITACIRQWELDSSQKQAAKIAVAPLSVMPRTVTKVETLRCPGCFIVYLNLGEEGSLNEIRLSDWKVSFDESEHICTQEEQTAQACTADYSPVCGKIVLNIGEIRYETFSNGCMACSSMKTVSYTNGECPKEEFFDGCTDYKGNSMSYKDAIEIAKNSECGLDIKSECGCPEGYRLDGKACNPECYYSKPSCMMPSIECAMPYMCNPETGTMWIGMTLKKDGCSPACVVNVESREAEINWRCTGRLLD